MSSINSIIRLLSIFITGIVFTYVLYNSYHHDNLFLIFILAILGLLWIFLFYKTIKSDKQKCYKPSKTISFVSILLGVMFIVINSGIYFYYQSKINSLTLLKARGHGVYADFKSNGEYIIKSGSWASRIHFYGEYELQDSILILDRDSLDETLFTNKYVILELDNPENKLLYWKIEKKGNYIIPIMNNTGRKKSLLLGFSGDGEEVFGPYRFEITEDKRDN